MSIIVRRVLFLIRYHFYYKYSIRKTVREKIRGRKFLVYPSVFNPKSFYSGKIFADFVCGLGDLKGKYVLDMGCGSGVMGIFAALKGAEVTAADINPTAVKCTIENAKINGVSDRVKVYESNLFEKLDSASFDFILFNPPYYPKEAKSDFELGFNAGADYKVIRDFAKQCKEYLKKEGCIYMIVSSDIGIEIMKKIFTEGFKLDYFRVKRKFFESFFVVKVTNSASNRFSKM